MSPSRFVKAAGGGALLTLIGLFLAAMPMHTAPGLAESADAVPRGLAYHALPPKPQTQIGSGTSVAQDAASDTNGSAATDRLFPANSNRNISGAAESSSETREAEKFFFKSANRERAEQGFAQLKWDEALAAAARKHAALMADQEELSHRLPGEAALDARMAQAGARFSSVGENVAIGPEAPEIHNGWMHSPGHRANILGPHFNALGVGVAERDGQLYAVEDFSRAVENLSVEQQEKQVAAMLTARGFQVPQAVEDLEAARKLCNSGSAAARSLLPSHPNMEILRYEAADLGGLPEQLDRSLRNSRYRQAAVGACQDAAAENGIPRFRVVILLFSQV